MCRFGLHFRDLYVGGGPSDASDGGRGHAAAARTRRSVVCCLLSIVCCLFCPLTMHPHLLCLVRPRLHLRELHVVVLLSHCCHTVVTLWLHCCYTVVTLLSHCCYSVVTLLSQCCYTVVTLLSHCCYSVVTLLLHCCYTVVRPGLYFRDLHVGGGPGDAGDSRRGYAAAART
jgi:hypothetical protein